MYLKRLDIHGFKSFANRTQLVFGPGVSCVVGPNGTGKTNVADALRWVLGEHASRTIRARKTEDVIFAGSDRRPPMGIAEVSITLDNSEHWLPIDFDEVVVARRAYRSGENEYLINNSKVRLRDVVDLFMRADVGQNSYAFLGQGMVEQVLSLRPEDRRALIEEAADVRVYRTKLEDARNKLKATRENTERVRMLVREIEPRINQLQRQASRAVRYQELTRELATLLHAWYAHQWQETNDLLLAALTTHDQCVAEAERVRTQAQSYDEGLQQLRIAIERRTAEIGEREGALRSLEEYARDLERRLALDAERSKMLSSRLEELAAELDSLRADLAQSPEAAALPADVAEAQGRLALAREELEAARRHAADLEGELSELRASAAAHEHAAARALVAVEDRTRRIEELTDHIARIHRQRDAAIEEQQRTANEARACQDEITALSEQSAGLATRIEDAVTARQAEAEIITELRRQQAEMEEETREMMARVEALAARLQVMEELDFKPEPPDAGIRAVLEAGGILPREHVPEDIELHGVVGLVRELVRPVPGLERAVDAALAENLHAVVFERESELRRAVDMLTSSDTGRATIYALDAVQDVRPLHLIKERGILGVASGMVRCHPRHRRLIDSLIGRVVVVEDISMAHRVVRRGLAQAVATLDGVLVRPIGAVSAGTSRAIEATFVRAREVGDLPEEIERLRPEIERRQASIRDLTARQEKAQARMDELAASADALRAERAHIDAEIAAANVRLSTLLARAEALAESRQRYDDEASDVQQERERFEVERAVKADEARAAAEAEEQARTRVAELEEASRAATARSQELAEEVVRLDALVRGAGGVTQGELEARERLQRQVEQREQQQARLEQEAHDVAARVAATERELHAKQAEIEALRLELQPAREELAQLAGRERELTALLAESNERVRSADRDALEAEHEVRIRKEELESLRVSLEAEGFMVTADGDVQRAPEQPREDSVPETGERDAGAPDGGAPAWMRVGGEDDALPPIRGASAINATEMRDRISELRGQIRGLGPINEEAAAEYEQSRERYEFLTAQLADLQQAEDQLLEAIDELEKEIRARFRETFKTVNQEFERYFSAFFRGGTARLELGENDDEGLPGVEIVAQPPGKKLGSLALLSGGERSLTAVALLFALLQANPSPICVLDEVDAALDEANVGRFVDELRALAEKTQFIIITHNRRTIEQADTIYGVSMGADSVSRVLSLKLEDVPDHAE